MTSEQEFLAEQQLMSQDLSGSRTPHLGMTSEQESLAEQQLKKQDLGGSSTLYLCKEVV